MVTRCTTKIEERPVEEEKVSPKKLKVTDTVEQVSPPKPRPSDKARHTEFSFDPDVIGGGVDS